MSLYPCSGCGERQPGKLAQTTWSWWRADNVRVAWRQRLCLACFAMTVAPLETATREMSTTCPACGIDTSEDMDPVYCTTYVPSVGPVRLEMPLCAPCAAEVRIRAEKGAWRPEDRDPASVGRGPQTDDPWSKLGLLPR